MIRAFLAIVLALVLALGWSLWRTEVHKGKADEARTALAAAQTELAQTKVARERERKQAESMADIGDLHEQDRIDAEGVPDAVVADLRAGNRRLQKHWAECATGRLSDSAAAALERDAAAQRREADFGNLVRVGRDADDQLRACQAVIRVDREVQ